LTKQQKENREILRVRGDFQALLAAKAKHHGMMPRAGERGRRSRLTAVIGAAAGVSALPPLWYNTVTALWALNDRRQGREIGNGHGIR
jgi:hypothetical protein